MTWTPRILTEFEIGQAAAAIEAVDRMEKPYAEVGCRIGALADLEADLLDCLRSAGAAGRVRIALEQRGDHVWFGFYAHAWVERARAFLASEDLAPQDRHWINGLLFGYRASAIQRFITEQQPNYARHAGAAASPAETPQA